MRLSEVAPSGQVEVTPDIIKALLDALDRLGITSFDDIWDLDWDDKPGSTYEDPRIMTLEIALAMPEDVGMVDEDGSYLTLLHKRLANSMARLPFVGSSEIVGHYSPDVPDSGIAVQVTLKPPHRFDFGRIKQAVRDHLGWTPRT
jgi:hypothetical protein